VPLHTFSISKAEYNSYKQVGVREILCIWEGVLALQKLGKHCLKRVNCHFMIQRRNLRSTT